MFKCACRAAFGGGAGSLTSPCRIKKDKVTTVNGNNCDSAFTLAEVLITLGIIGIVAAMTLPSVIVNYQKQEALTRLKKSYTTVANAFSFPLEFTLLILTSVISLVLSPFHALSRLLYEFSFIFNTISAYFQPFILK